jgi:hypothetical protein
MEWIVNDKSTATRIVESETLLQLKQWLFDINCQCKVTLTHCDPYFFLTKEERRNMTGPIGLIGAVGAPGYRSQEEIEEWERTRPIANIERICVTFQFIMSNEKAEEIKSHELLVTPNELGDIIPIWQITNIQEYTFYTCGIYKREGFDDAYNAIKRLKPSLTEEEFAFNRDSQWDSDLVDIKLYHGSDNCLDTNLICDRIKSAKSNVRLTLRAIDIDKNLEYIKVILSAYKSSYDKSLQTFIS